MPVRSGGRRSIAGVARALPMRCAFLRFVVVAVAAAPAAAADHMRPQCATTAAATLAATAAAAQEMCSSAPMEEVLNSVWLQPASARSMEQLLASLGLRTALDIQLLGSAGPDSPEAEDLMKEVTAAGFSIGDRSKIRHLLLITGGEQDLPDNGQGTAVGVSPNPADVRLGRQRQQRRLQEEAASGGGASFDTIAIILSVLVGGAGCDDTPINRSQPHLWLTEPTLIGVVCCCCKCRYIVQVPARLSLHQFHWTPGLGLSRSRSLTLSFLSLPLPRPLPLAPPHPALLTLPLLLVSALTIAAACMYKGVHSSAGRTCTARSSS
eukprot:SAG31_NODE_1297_length_8934_cov_26.567176_11_plen_323_part_00